MKEAESAREREGKAQRGEREGKVRERETEKCEG
jgi:hypothetical protein